MEAEFEPEGSEKPLEDASSGESEGTERRKPKSDEAQMASFAKEIDTLIQHIDSLDSSFPLTSIILQGAHWSSYSAYKKFVDENCEERNENGKDVIEVPPHLIPEYNRLARQANNGALAVKTVPRSLLVALVSQFDSFLGGLLRVLYYRNPALLNASERSLTLSQLVEFNSIANAREFILEKEIETVLRKSHAEQFQWLEKKFDLPLRKDLPAWATFIELTERRNLFVHANGIVSSQYLRVCKEHGANIESGVKVGDELDVSPEYFSRAYRCVYEIGVKLSHVLWRKEYPNEIANADKNLNNVAYELLREEKNELAITLLDFATLILRKHSNEQNRRIAVVNRAQAYKWIGNSEKANEIVEAEDWSATSVDFKLATAVLKDDFQEAAAIMKSIGSDGSPGKSDYTHWPLFKEFRKSNEFLQTFEEVFGETFKVLATEEEKIAPEPPSEAQESNGSQMEKEVESIN